MEAEHRQGCRDLSVAQTPAPASLVDVDDRLSSTSEVLYAV